MILPLHLVTPVLIPAIWPKLGKDPWSRALVATALPIACALNAGYFALSFSRFSESEATFARLNAIVLEHQRVLGATEIAGLLAVDGRPVVDSGQSEYFNVAGFGHSIPGLIDWNLLEDRWERFVSGMESEISAGRYDLIVRSRRNGLIPADLLEERYRRIETFDIDFRVVGPAVADRSLGTETGAVYWSRTVVSVAVVCASRGSSSRLLACRSALWPIHVRRLTEEDLG